MQLKPDCVRAILLWLESNQKIDLLGNVETITTLDLAQHIDSFSAEEVLYAAKQMINNEFLEARLIQVNGAQVYQVIDITPKAHEFLENIRLDTNWNKTKEKAKSVGSFALTMLEKISASVIAAGMSSQLGI